MDSYMSTPATGPRGQKRSHEQGDSENPQHSSTQASQREALRESEHRTTQATSPGEEGEGREESEVEKDVVMQHKNQDEDSEGEEEEEEEEELIEDGNVRPKKTKTILYRVKRVDLPDDAEHFKSALFTHIRLLAFFETPDARILPRPTAEMHEDFDRHFTSLLWHQLPTPEEAPPLQILMQSQVNQLRAALQKSAEAHKIARLEDALINNVCANLAKYGFTKWLPDIYEDPYSPYNVAHRYVCLETFKQACISSHYRTLEPNLVHLNNYGLMTSIYDHYVFYRLKRRTEKEQRQPGALEAAAKASRALDRRSKLAEARFRFALGDLYPKRICRMLRDVHCHSDDELGEQDNKIVYFKNARTGRSHRMSIFLQKLDARRKQLGPAELSCRTWRQERTRVNRTVPKPSPWPKVPESVPLDYFDPSFFNVMPVGFRARYTQPPIIAFPKDVNEDNVHEIWKLMSDKDFMAAYGEDVLNEYKIPTSAEISALKALESPRSGQGKRKDERAVRLSRRMDTRTIAQRQDKGKGREKPVEDGTKHKRARLAAPQSGAKE